MGGGGTTTLPAAPVTQTAGLDQPVQVNPFANFMDSGTVTPNPALTFNGSAPSPANAVGGPISPAFSSWKSGTGLPDLNTIFNTPQGALPVFPNSQSFPQPPLVTPGSAVGGGGAGGNGAGGNGAGGPAGTSPVWWGQGPNGTTGLLTGNPTQPGQQQFVSHMQLAADTDNNGGEQR